MATRFTDDLFNNTDGSDFIVRRRLPVAIQIFLIFAVAFGVIYVTASVMSSTGSSRVFLITLLLTIGSLTWFTIFTSARLRDLVLATEFQNAMLASAAQLSTRFCLIVKKDGSIVYIDQGFQRMFPHFLQSSDRNVERLLESAGASREAINRVILMLQNGENDRLQLPLQDEDGKSLPVMLSVDVLPRPRGYFLMRGRDYVEKRSAENKASPELPVSGIEQALAMASEGILVSDSSGIITYASPALESWLGFAPGEMKSRKFKIGQILYQYAGSEANRPVNANFEGEVVLQRKDRSLASFHLKQTASGKPAAISAVIRAGVDVKKK